MLPHLVQPLVLLRSAPRPRGARYMIIESLDGAALPETARQEMRAAERALVAHEFGLAIYIASTSSNTVNSYVGLFEHPTEPTLATTMCFLRRAGDPRVTTLFSTRFADGVTLTTSNSPTLLRTPPRPHVDNAKFTFADAGALYEIHRKRVAERAQRVSTVRVTRLPDPIAFLDREAREAQDFWVKAGYHRYVDGDRMALTRLGATLSSWRGLAPWKQLTQRSYDRKTRAICERLGIHSSSRAE